MFGSNIIDPRFLPADLFYCYVDPFFNSAEASKTLDDKNLYDLLFPDVNQPDTIARKINGVLLNDKYEIIDEEGVLCKCKDVGVVILKETIESSGGLGCKVWSRAEGEDLLLSYINSARNIIVQGFLTQDEAIAYIHPTSVNTIRVMSLVRKGEVSILSTIFRMGVQNNKVDNATSGGIFCGVDDHGQLKKMRIILLVKNLRSIQQQE